VREGLSRLAPALVLIAFCFPLFIGLGQPDLANDEAIYSFAVESILRTGDWLSPRSSPNLHIVFLEKPPLKFWIVAAPIRLGLLPLDEFGLRFWDAVFGGAAFVYVFLLGRRLAGPLCGIVAVLVLFAHEPLLFDHGLRSNNMDAALVLAYCAGVYHYLRWAESGQRGRQLWQAVAVGAAFYLGFMTKFVAALFLPLVLGMAAVVNPAHRSRLREDGKRWLAIAAGVAALALPWFVYEYLQHRQVLFDVMFGEHVYTRFTSFADPGHLNPWHFYITTAYETLVRSGSALWVAWGLAILAVDGVRKRLADAWVVILWLVLPVTLISLGSSKLYHYFYPYVPPLALAAGYGVAWLARAVQRIAERWFGRGGAVTNTPGRAVRAAASVLAVLAVLLAIATAINGPLHIVWGDQLVFRNTSIDRPLIIAALAGATAGGLRVAVVVAAAMAAWLLLPTPVDGYFDNLAKLRAGTHPMRSMADCIRRVNADRAAAGLEVPGVYAPVSEAAYLHPYFYYLRGSGWHARGVDNDTVRTALAEPGAERPVILDVARYGEYLEQTGGAGGSVTSVNWPNVVLLLPGAYDGCRATQQVRRR
jgi:4-amino-4-deoxy-L-arabinose transferase-like glycosyltransferase